MNKIKFWMSLVWLMLPKKHINNIWYKYTGWCIYQTQCSRGCSTTTSVTDSFIYWVIEHPFPLNLQDIINLKPLQLGNWHFRSMFTLHHVSHLTCQVSGVRCQMSDCNFFFFYKVMELVGGGYVINGAYPV